MPRAGPRQIILKNPEYFFAEGHRGGPRQRFKKKIKTFICRGSALGKQIQKKIHFFAEGRPSAKKPPTAPASDGVFSLPRAILALGKGFAECPIKGPRQRPLRRLKIPRGVFAEGSPRQSLCRGFLVLCRGPEALGKACASSSGCWSAAPISKESSCRPQRSARGRIKTDI